MKKLLCLLFFASLLSANESFFTITICNQASLENALACKDGILRKREFDVIITKKGNGLYKTNYGLFENINEAISQQSKLNRNLRTSILKIENNPSSFEFYEFFAKRIYLFKGNRKASLKKNIKSKANKKIALAWKAEIERRKKAEEARKKAAEAERKRKENEQKYQHYEPYDGIKIAYLSFDDGPILASHNVMKVLKEQDIKASFFYIGFQMLSNKSILTQARTLPKILLANHTYSHANGKYQKFYSDADGVLQDVNKAQKILDTSTKFLRLAGRNVFRLPQISSNDIAINSSQTSIEKLAYDKVAKAGYEIFGWDVEWRFDKAGRPTQSPYEVVKEMEYSVKHGRSKKKGKVILLSHDIMFGDNYDGVNNLTTFIKLLKKNGWAFDSLDNY